MSKVNYPSALCVGAGRQKNERLKQIKKIKIYFFVEGVSREILKNIVRPFSLVYSICMHTYIKYARGAIYSLESFMLSFTSFSDHAPHFEMCFSVDIQ